MKVNTFWISTVPRTGSMWLYNITREILKNSKFNVIPNQIPQQDKECYKILLEVIFFIKLVFNCIIT